MISLESAYSPKTCQFCAYAHPAKLNTFDSGLYQDPESLYKVPVAVSYIQKKQQMCEIWCAEYERNIEPFNDQTCPHFIYNDNT